MTSYKLFFLIKYYIAVKEKLNIYRYIHKIKNNVLNYRYGITFFGSLAGFGYLLSRVYDYTNEELAKIGVNGVILSLLAVSLMLDHKERKNTYTGIGKKDQAHHGSLILY